MMLNILQDIHWENTQLLCSGVLSFENTIKILKLRGKAMQEAVPKGKVE